MVYLPRSRSWVSVSVSVVGCSEVSRARWSSSRSKLSAQSRCLKAGTGDASHGADLLGPLAHNGGPTETMLALAANPAVGVVPPNTTVKLDGRSLTLCPATDQRGVHSAAGKACNAGALQSPTP
jgi:hypothetical protein